MGPLNGIKIIEIAGIGPGPFATMMLADMGAEVLRVDRADKVKDPGVSGDLLARGRRSIGVDLKSPKGVEVVLRLVEKADALFEGFRPGVMERLGLGYEAIRALCHSGGTLAAAMPRCALCGYSTTVTEDPVRSLAPTVSCP